MLLKAVFFQKLTPTCLASGVSCWGGGQLWVNHSNSGSGILGISRAGGLQACQSAWDRLAPALTWAEGVTNPKGPAAARRAASQPPPMRPSPTQPCNLQHPRPKPSRPAGPPPKPRPRTPPGRKQPRLPGWGPIGPPPPPHPNFGALRIEVVD